MTRLSKALMVCLLSIFHQNGGNLNCKEEPCSCCRSGMCADPHLSVLPCDSCIDGYCGPSCYEHCPASCVNCSQLFYEEETERVCSHCKAGFYNGRYKDIGSYPLQQDCSLHCVENCLQCTSYYNCIQCKPQYYLSYGKDCLRCVDKCIRCTSRTDCLDCEDGHVWNGEICEACEDGYFGRNCLKRCPDTCKNKCNKSTGLCVSCKDGYFLNHNKSCLKCPNHCNDCLSNESCVTCSAGYMGDNCNVKCSNCKTGTACDKFTGYCLDSCRNGFSGKGCNLLCNSKCFLCDRNNPRKCVSCASGKYGKTCINECSNNCVNNSCSETDGECVLGCKNGCWGDNCEHSCSKDCIDETCERRNGSCRKLCIDNPDRKKCICPGNCECDKDNHCARCLHGSGEFCDTPCSKGCVNDTCSLTTGECLQGCLPGFHGSHCSSDRGDEDLGDTGRANITVIILVVCTLGIGLTAVTLFLRSSRSRKCMSLVKRWLCFKVPQDDFRQDELPPLSNVQNRVAEVITGDNKQDSVDLLDKNTVTDTSVSLKVDIPILRKDETGASTVGSRDDKKDNAKLLEKKIIGSKLKVKQEGSFSGRTKTSDRTKTKQDTLRVELESGDSGYSSERVSPSDALIGTEV